MFNEGKIVKAAIYTRVSTEDQANDGYGLEVQLTKCRAQLIVKDWQNVGEYQDAGISGTKGVSQRPGLSALLDAAKNGDVNAVVVLAFDRLGRNTRLVLELVETFTRLNVDVVSCKENLDTSTPQGRFVLTMFAALAQLERDTIAERTSDGRNERGKVDGERGGRVPMGYARNGDGERVVIDEDQARVVRYIFKMRQDGFGLRPIAAILNDDGITTPRGHKWHASSVKEVLANEDKYRGGSYQGVVTKQVDDTKKTRKPTGKVIVSDWRWPVILD